MTYFTRDEVREALLRIAPNLSAPLLDKWSSRLATPSEAEIAFYKSLPLAEGRIAPRVTPLHGHERRTLHLDRGQLSRVVEALAKHHPEADPRAVLDCAASITAAVKPEARRIWPAYVKETDLPPAENSENEWPFLYKLTLTDETFAVMGPPKKRGRGQSGAPKPDEVRWPADPREALHAFAEAPGNIAEAFGPPAGWERAIDREVRETGAAFTTDAMQDAARAILARAKNPDADGEHLAVAIVGALESLDPSVLGTRLYSANGEPMPRDLWQRTSAVLRAVGRGGAASKWPASFMRAHSLLRAEAPPYRRSRLLGLKVPVDARATHAEPLGDG
jgi:hypothetical protein